MTTDHFCATCGTDIPSSSWSQCEACRPVQLPTLRAHTSNGEHPCIVTLEDHGANRHKIYDHFWDGVKYQWTLIGARYGYKQRNRALKVFKAFVAKERTRHDYIKPRRTVHLTAS